MSQESDRDRRVDGTLIELKGDRDAHRERIHDLEVRVDGVVRDASHAADQADLARVDAVFLRADVEQVDRRLSRWVWVLLVALMLVGCLALARWHGEVADATMDPGPGGGSGGARGDVGGIALP